MASTSTLQLCNSQRKLKRSPIDLEVLLKAEPANAAAKEELVETKRLLKDEANAPNPKKSPKDMASFSELSTKKTNATASSLPARDRAQGVKIPIKVVPRFTTRPFISQEPDIETIPSRMNSVGGPSDLSKSARNAHTSTAAVADTPVPADSGSAFSSHKVSRGAKSSFACSSTIAAPSSIGKALVGNEESGRMLSGVKPPSSGLELVDRLQDLAEEGESRWQLLQSITPQKMAALVGGILEPDHLALIYSAMAHRTRTGISREEKDSILSYLRALRSIPRWKMTEALLLPDERKTGEDLWKFCNT
ncbi:hypothetical protein QFC21_001264 [Naganishia friedmannii]|uniref:Uncharacterized protein n=1 Tax=Naganishia friedmannii TaxID=89922 RepID=A0ACC2W4W0_9TREE|nr:hypothetical protein QFC21_001264 [Naganishia friedmannii]